MRLFPLFLIISQAKSSFFDVCPSSRESIGECLAGLCPAGSKCINNHCCIPTNTRKFTTHRRRQPIIDPDLIVDIEKIRKKKGGACYVRGNEPIGVCLGDDVCPIGYTCENDSCCNIEEGRRLRSRKKKKRRSEEEEELTEEEEDVLAREREKNGEDDEDDDEDDEITSEENTEDGEEEEEEEADNKSEERRASEEDDDRRVEEEEEEEEDPEEEEVEDFDMIRANRANRIGFRRYKAKRKPTKFTEEIPEAEEIEENSGAFETKNVCPIGYPIGECVSRQCPDGYACYKNSCYSLPKCHAYLCDIDGYSDFMSQFCPKTCAKCSTIKSNHRSSSKKSIITSTITPVYGQRGGGQGVPRTYIQQSGIRPELCTDRRSDCGEWANSGFCTSNIYSTAQKMKFCGRSCGYC